MQHIVQDMFLESPKKNSVRYDAIDSSDFAINAVYLMKSAFKGSEPPKKIRITITELE
jgi:hypothetical protein